MRSEPLSVRPYRDFSPIGLRSNWRVLQFRYTQLAIQIRVCAAEPGLFTAVEARTLVEWAP
jgi:hypothetical protein